MSLHAGFSPAAASSSRYRFVADSVSPPPPLCPCMSPPGGEEAYSGPIATEMVL